MTGVQTCALPIYFTLNNVLPEWYQQAHQTSARYPLEVSEFEACGFEPFFLDDFSAPFVKQSTIKTGISLHQIVDVDINGTTIVIGEITHIALEDELIGEDGYVNHHKAGTVTVAGLDSYFTTESLGREAYAKARNL